MTIPVSIPSISLSSRCYRDNEGFEQVCQRTVRLLARELGQVENLTHNRSPGDVCRLSMMILRPLCSYSTFPDELKHVLIFTIPRITLRKGG